MSSSISTRFNRPTHIQLTKGFHESARWRQSVLKPYLEPKNQTDFSSLNEEKQLAAKTTDNVFVQYIPVSMAFLNKFWREIKECDLAPTVELFVLKEDFNNLPKGTTLCLVEDANPAAVNDKGELGLTFKVSDSFSEITQEVILPNSFVMEKTRRDWTISDIVQYIIKPELTNPENNYKFYTDKIRVEHKHYLGEVFSGAYLICPRDTKFHILMESLKSRLRAKDLRDFDAYIFLDIFSSDLKNIDQASLPGNTKLRQQYNRTIGSNLQTAIKSFDERLVFVDDWLNPKVLKRIWCVWELYNAFNCNKMFDILVQDVEDVEKVWQGVENNIFEHIAKLDLAKLSSNSTDDYRVIRHFLPLDKGFHNVQQILKVKFRTWIALEAEKEVKYFYDIRAPDNEHKVGDLLLLTGNFMLNQRDLKVAKSYFTQAKELYERYKIEDLLIECKGDINAIEEIYTLSFVDTILTGLCKALLNIAKVYALYTHFPIALQQLEEARKIAKKLNSDKNVMLIECDRFEAEIHSFEGKFSQSIRCYSNVEFAWKTDATKVDKIADLTFRLGLAYMKVEDFNEAQKFFKLSLMRHRNYLASKAENKGKDKESLIDVFIGEITASVGECYSQQKVNTSMTPEQKLQQLRVFVEQSMAEWKKAMDIFTITLGESNSQVGKMHFYLGNGFARLRNFEESIKEFNLAVEVYEEYFGAVSREISRVFNNRGLCYLEMKDFVAAEENFTKAIETTRRLEIKSGDESDEDFEEGSGISKNSMKEKELTIASYSINLAQSLKKQNRKKEAKQYFEEALMIRKRELGDSDERTQAVEALFLLL